MGEEFGKLGLLKLRAYPVYEIYSSYVYSEEPDDYYLPSMPYT